MLILNFLSNKNDHSFTVDPIDLKTKNKKGLPEGYELGNICSKFYSMDKFLSISNKELLKDLEYLKINDVYRIKRINVSN